MPDNSAIPIPNKKITAKDITGIRVESVQSPVNVLTPSTDNTDIFYQQIEELKTSKRFNRLVEKTYNTVSAYMKQTECSGDVYNLAFMYINDNITSQEIFDACAQTLLNPGFTGYGGDYIMNVDELQAFINAKPELAAKVSAEAFSDTVFQRVNLFFLDNGFDQESFVTKCTLPSDNQSVEKFIEDYINICCLELQVACALNNSGVRTVVKTTAPDKDKTDAKITQLEQVVAKTRSELNAKDNKIKELEQVIADLESHDEQIADLERQLQKAKQREEKLTEKYNALKAKAGEGNNSDGESEMETNAPAFSSESKVLFVCDEPTNSGEERSISKIVAKFPNGKWCSDIEKVSLDLYEIVVILTKYTSHATYYKIINVCNRKKMEILHIPHVNADRVMQEVINKESFTSYD